MAAPTSINTLLSIHSDSRLEQLVKHSQKIQQLSALIKDYLPPPISNHCYVSNIRNNILYLCTDSPVWTMKTHYLTGNLLMHLRKKQGMHHLVTVQVRTRPGRFQKQEIKTPRKPISKNTATLISSIAKYSCHPKLKKALHNLVLHSKRHNIT